MRMGRFFSTSMVLLIVAVASCTSSAKKEAKKNNDTTGQTKKIEQPTKPLPTGLGWKNQTFKAENCDIQATDEMDYVEDWCSQRTVELLTVRLKDVAVAHKINQRITKAITGNSSGIDAISNYVNKVKETNATDLEENLFQETITCRVRDTSDRFLSLGIASDYYALGAAHGVFSLQVLNIDLSTGSKISLDNLFEPSGFRALTALAKKKFLQQNDDLGWWFTTDDQPFELAEVFALERKGIRFIYQQYEIGPYCAGLPEVFLSKEEVKSLLKDNPYWPK